MKDVLNSLIEHDEDFSESKVKSKISNMFVQIMLSTVTGKIEKIDHFVNDEVYEKIKEKVNEDKKNNRIQIYDELNASDVTIQNIEELEDCFKITASICWKAIDYFIDRETKKYLSGNNKSRMEKNANIELTKMKDAKAFNVVRKCPTCGAVVDVNATGECKYCHTIFNLEKYDWVITKMEI